ncbi:MAG: helix-turn-helix domain-containing protein [Lachnospiraceae bacterium]|jgi:beta-xylosidase/AraC-like DNA-binding protein|nr:helix-turn-helix domain-containing protein [Lachnospiraceae bacterium]
METRNLSYIVKRALKNETSRQVEMTILFLLEGKMTVRYRDEDFRMTEEDIILINPGTEYEITECTDALYGIAIYPMQLMSDILKNSRMMFYCNSVVDMSHSYRDLRDILFELTAEYTEDSHKSSAYNASLLLKLLDCLVENYQLEVNDLADEETEADARMREMMQYILSNLDRDINLNELADSMFVSASTLSRIFKKHTGVYFADYVMQLRVQSSLQLLRSTKQSITQIALTCGFANSASFNRSFRKVMGVAPTDYRKKFQGESIPEEVIEDNTEEDIREELKEKGYKKVRGEKSFTALIDLKKKPGVKYEKTWNKIMNVGAMSDLTKANIQYHTLFVNEHLHFSYFRVWSVFSRKMMLFDGRNIGVYNYDTVDQVLDFFVQHHLHPFLDFGRRPEVALSSENKPIFYNEEYIDFVSREAWESLLEDFISHIVSRYGLGVVSNWIFELPRDNWHESSHPEQGLYKGEYSFFDAFLFFLKTIRSKIPGAEVGGIGSVISYDEDYLRDFFAKCHENDVKPDFVSFILFPYEVPLYSLPGSDSGMHLTDSIVNEESENHRLLVISKDSDCEEVQIDKISALMKSAGMEDVKTYITEWNNTISNRNALNDSCFRAAYMVRKLINIYDKVDTINVMCASDWISSYMDTVGIAHGGIGLLTKDTIRKPAYYAIDFMNQLGEYVIDRTEKFIVSRKENGDIYIVCHNFSWFRENYLMQDEDVDILENRPLIFEDEKELNLLIRLKNFGTPGEYCVKRRTMNDSNGSILGEWSRFQFNTRLTRQDIKYLEAVCLPNLSQSVYSVSGEGDTMELELKLEPHEISLIHIFRT